MLKLQINSLNLQFTTGEKSYDFSAPITYFYGETTLGKSSIASLIRWCLGGKFNPVPAVKRTLVSAQLEFETDLFQVVFERTRGVGPVKAIWTDNKTYHAEMVPLKQESKTPPVVSPDIYTVSDLLFYLMGQKPIRVKKSKINEDSELIRLSFRDIFWYCYLRQDELDSSFFHLFEGEPKTWKSRDVQRYLFGYFSAQLTDLQEQENELRLARAANKQSAENLTQFLTKFGFESEARIKSDIDSIHSQIAELKTKKSQLRAELYPKSHTTDELRDHLRTLGRQIARDEVIYSDLNRIIENQQKLRSEIISARFKLSKTEAARKVLATADFEKCPACGEQIEQPEEGDSCRLCHKHGNTAGAVLEEILALRNDFDSRADELLDSVTRHRKTLAALEREISTAKERKSEMDSKLSYELEQYDSIYVTRTRELDENIAALNERALSLNRMSQMPQEIERLNQKVDQDFAVIQTLKRKIADEKKAFVLSEKIIQELEVAYINCMVEAKVPDVSFDDTCWIDRHSWIPTIFSHGDELLDWDYSNGGAGGRTTLVKLCYVIAFHIVAKKFELALPRLLIIDSPMKNLAGTRNQKFVRTFYDFLYKCSTNELRDHQIIVMDSELFEPQSTVALERLQAFDMTDDPLVPNYSSEQFATEDLTTMDDLLSDDGD